jgi:hypothetical protein
MENEEGEHPTSLAKVAANRRNAKLSTEDAVVFEDLLQGLSQAFQPEGALEHMLVEKLVVCLWRKRRVLLVEARDLETTPMRSIPYGGALDCILRYDAAADRQFAQTLTQLERLQRTRKGENVPAPIELHVTAGG